MERELSSTLDSKFEWVIPILGLEILFGVYVESKESSNNKIGSENVK